MEKGKLGAALMNRISNRHRPADSAMIETEGRLSSLHPALHIYMTDEAIYNSR